MEQVKLINIAKDNYLKLLKYCETLNQEGYWEKAEKILNQTIYEALDLYVQSVLINLAKSCERLNNIEVDFIKTIPYTNEIEIDKNIDETIIARANRIFLAPPIILQLCGLKDTEKNTNTVGYFFDKLLNIILAMVYLDGGKTKEVIVFIQQYFKKVSAFLVSSGNSITKIDEKYLFRKLTSDESNFYEDKFFKSDSYSGSVSLSPRQNMLKDGKLINKNLDKKQDKIYIDNNIDLIDDEQKEELTVDNIKVVEQNNENVNINTDEVKDDEELTKLLKKLNSLIGLKGVKEEINSLINLIKIRKMREKYNMPMMEMSYHMVFTGNPGTGKTTVARLVAKIYKELGILSKGTLVETDRSGLVAGYIGQTALKVKEVVDKAIGGVLFIDEAYSLANNTNGNDFGTEAIDTLVKLMEDNRDDLVVIVAGYTKEMKKFLASNSGLVSRFNKYIEFFDYNIDELMDIFVSMADKSGMTVTNEALNIIRKYVLSISVEELASFGNARGMRNIFEKVVVNQANRLVYYENPTKEQLCEITKEDVKYIKL